MNSRHTMRLKLNNIFYTGSTAGYQLVTITGTGFDDDTVVTICDQPCKMANNHTSSTQYVCFTPAAPGKPMSFKYGLSLRRGTMTF